jgi:hypothetical protein
MADTGQSTSARPNIGRAAAAAKKKRTIARLSRFTRIALGKQESKAARPRPRHCIALSVAGMLTS